ncbi:RNA polymerase subunit sigma-70 [Flavobacterium album]|uniref:RNA polymerase subunit sigma-70 n=1 Tax=Flavobacterium album TaxID=2175091 RepID=A0A2S1QTI5_9FLAO|nr:RNA polymerase subunit sigma-70 [Flavobacterium album]
MACNGLQRIEIAGKRCSLVVPCYRNYPYLHTDKCLSNEYFFKTCALEVTPASIQKNIEKAKKGDQVAFTFLLDHFWNEVYGFMLKRTQNETDTEDIVIETFVKAFDKIATYNPEYAFNTWLIAIAKNVHIDLLRKKKSSLFIEITDEEDQQAYRVADSTPTVEDQLITEQNLSSLLNCIKQLKPQYQEVIQLRYFQEMSYQEIADQLGEPLNNVKVKLLRAKKLLADIISKK